MDPNAAYEELAEMANIDLSGCGGDIETVEQANERSLRYAELFESLDIWLKRGGFLPTAWQH
jgi:hypothetical protein